MVTFVGPPIMITSVPFGCCTKVPFTVIDPFRVMFWPSGMTILLTLHVSFIQREFGKGGGNGQLGEALGGHLVERNTAIVTSRT